MLYKGFVGNGPAILRIFIVDTLGASWVFALVRKWTQQLYSKSEDIKELEDELREEGQHWANNLLG